jgi:hypothetical protein
MRRPAWTRPGSSQGSGRDGRIGTVLARRWPRSYRLSISCSKKGRTNLLRRTLLLAAACAVSPTLSHGQPFDATSAADSAVAPREFSFAVMRNGTKIGDYSLQIATEGKSQTVDITTDLKVNVLMFTAYQLHQEAREIWTNGTFVSYHGKSDDNGKNHVVSLVATSAGLTLNADGKKTALGNGAIPASFWNNKFVDVTTMVDPDDGKVTPVKVDDLGPDQIDVEGAPVEAHHYHIRGLDRDVWMSKGMPVRFQMKGSDNSTIVSQLQPGPAPAAAQ